MKTVKARERFDEPVTATVLEQAIVCGRKQRSQGLRAMAVQYLPAFKSLLISFADQSAVVLPVKNYPDLAELNTTELERLAVGFGGSALCLDERDLHVSIAGLVSASQPLMEMAATVMSARYGSYSSTASAPTIPPFPDP